MFSSHSFLLSLNADLHLLASDWNEEACPIIVLARDSIPYSYLPSRPNTPTMIK